MNKGVVLLIVFLLSSFAVNGIINVDIGEGGGGSSSITTDCPDGFVMQNISSSVAECVAIASFDSDFLRNDGDTATGDYTFTSDGKIHIKSDIEGINFGQVGIGSYEISYDGANAVHFVGGGDIYFKGGQMYVKDYIYGGSQETLNFDNAYIRFQDNTQGQNILLKASDDGGDDAVPGFIQIQAGEDEDEGDTYESIYLNRNGGDTVVGSSTSTSRSALITKGGRLKETTKVSSNYSVSAREEEIFVDSDAGDITITLPSFVENGQHYRIVNIGSSGNTVSVEVFFNFYTVKGVNTYNISDGEDVLLTYVISEGFW